MFGLDVPAAAEQFLGTAYKLVDPLGRDYREARADSLKRSALSLWEVPTASKAIAYADLRALALATSIVVRSMLPANRPVDTYSDRWGSALARTMQILAKKEGYKDESVEQVRAASKGNVAAEMWVIIVAIVLAAIVVAGAIAYVIYKSADVVDRQLSRGPAERELVRLHAEAERVTREHLEREKTEGHSIAWSQSELAVLESLEKQQARILGLMTPAPTPPPSSSAASAFGVGGLVGIAVALGGLAYAFKKGWL